MLLLALSSGCIDNSVSTAPSTPTVKQGVTPGPSPVPTISLAKVQSISQPKPINPASTNGPRLAIDAESVDFGNIPYSDVVAISFNLKNVGSAPVTLGPAFIRVREGC